MPMRLSLNTNPLVNRFADVDDLCGTLAEKIGAGYIQLVPELLNPSWPAATISKRERQFRNAFAREGIRATSVMTSTFTRLNHMGHPDADVRRYYVDWFKTLADIAGAVGAESMGSQFAIFTQKDYNDTKRREELINIVIDCWREVAEHAKSAGLKFIFWEPMSVGREFGHTIAECRSFDKRLAAANLALPFRMIVDIDPYAWAAAFPVESPIIHVKQSSMNKGGHWPFTAQHNKDGRIQPQKLIDTVKRAGGTDTEICMELSFREREPTDSNVVEMIAESVAFWEPFIDTGRNPRR
jgi:D-erythrulose 1-phosphate 3-epimerase